MCEVKISTPVDLTHRGRLGFLLKDSALYGGAAAISKSFALITFPLLTRHFSVADYGVLDYFLVLASFLAILFIFGQDSAVARYFYEHEDAATRCQIISQSLVFQLVGLALCLPLLWWGADWLTGLLIEAPDSAWLFKIVLLQLPFLLLINFSQNLLKWTFARAKFFAMSLGFTVAQASLLVVAVLVFDIGIKGVLLVSLSTSAVFGLLGLLLVRCWLTRPSDFRFLREMLPFAIPYGVICVLGAFSPTLERTLTGQLLGAEDLGLYAAGTKIAMLIGLVVSAFQTAWGPFSLSLYKQADAAHTYNWVLKLFAIGMCALVFALTLVAQSLIQLLAPDRYVGASAVVFPLAMGLAIQATSWITEIGIGISKKSYLSLYSYIVFLSVTALAIYIFVNAYGLLGVALGVMVGHIAKSFMGSWLAQRVYKLPWAYGPVVTLMAVTMAIGFLGAWSGLAFSELVASVVYAAGTLILFAVGYFLLFSADDRRRILTEIQVLRIRVLHPTIR